MRPPSRSRKFYRVASGSAVAFRRSTASTRTNRISPCRSSLNFLRSPSLRGNTMMVLRFPRISSSLKRTKSTPTRILSDDLYQIYLMSNWTCGSRIICLFTCGIYPLLWNLIKEKIKYREMTLRNQISIGVTFTLVFVQTVLIMTIAVSFVKPNYTSLSSTWNYSFRQLVINLLSTLRTFTTFSFFKI